MSDLRAFRVDDVLRDERAALGRVLRARGFSPCGLGRFSAHVAQDEKIELVTRLLKDHAGDLADVSVVPIDDLYAAKRAPHLKVVSS
jgi:acetolactate synthase regulatory subunit